MPVPNRIFSVIVPSASADFSAHTYSQVYAATLQTPTINGQAVKMAAGSKLDIMVKSISSAGLAASRAQEAQGRAASGV